ncbi:MAG: hypothetical protein PVH68_18995 [Armatimonadota bacterium]|jgi:hypothetical protein
MMAMDIGLLMLWRGLGPPEEVGDVAPGIEAAFMLAPEQRQKLVAMRRAVFESEPLMAAMSTLESGDATDEQKRAARMTVSAAGSALRERAAPILTPEQKELAKEINGAFFDTLRTLLAEYADTAVRQLTADVGVMAEKGGTDGMGERDSEVAETAKTEFAKRLDAILTKEQRAAMAKAAEEATEGE